MGKDKGKAKLSQSEALAAVADIRKANKKLMDSKKSLDRAAARHTEARKDHRANEKALSLLILEYTEPTLFNQTLQDEEKKKARKSGGMKTADGMAAVEAGKKHLDGEQAVAGKVG